MQFYSNGVWSEAFEIASNGDSCIGAGSFYLVPPCDGECLRFVAIARYVDADFLFFDWHENALPVSERDILGRSINRP